MANVLVNDLYLSDIADAIREKLDTEDTYKPSEMANAIESISGGGITPTGTKSITANGTYDVTSFASAEVNVPTGSTPVINSLSVTENGTYTAPSGVDGYSPVTVNVPNTYSAGDEGKVVSNGALVSQTSDTVTSNGTVDTTLINSLTVNVSGGGGSGITRETVEYTLTSASYTANVPVQGDTSKALFAHFYDKDATYTTANTTYEGIIIGPALVHYQAMLDSKQWSFWRTNAAGSTTGINNYAGSNAVFQTNIVVIAGNPILKADHTYVVDVFYES